MTTNQQVQDKGRAAPEDAADMEQDTRDRRDLVRVILALAVLVVGAVCAVTLGSVTVVDGNRMSTLVIKTSGLPGFKIHSSSSGFAPPAYNASPIVRKAGQTNPTETGAYETGWNHRSSASAGQAGVAVELLPTPALAAANLKYIEKQYTQAKSLGSEGLTPTGTFTIPGLPQAFAGTFTAGSGSSSTKSTNRIVIYRIGRMVAFQQVGTTTATVADSDVVTFAQREAALLRRADQDITLAATQQSIVIDLSIAVATVAIGAAIFFFPRIRQFFLARRRRRQEHALQKEHQHVRSRGNKVMRRQRRPSWQNNRHRAHR
jgi:hypothetical protein